LFLSSPVEAMNQTKSGHPKVKFLLLVWLHNDVRIRAAIRQASPANGDPHADHVTAGGNPAAR
jgi:hypothetical protein